MGRRLRIRLLGSAAAALLVGLPYVALADDAPKGGEAGASSAVEEVVVTAEKRSEPLMAVPESVTAISGQALESMHALSMNDWAGYVPGLNLSAGGAPGLTSAALDGIAPIGAASEVGIYVNDTPVGSSSSFEGASGFAIDLMPYDLNQVEVLRGPQGTLYGASTMGGLIKYDLAAPDLDHFSGEIGGDVFDVERANQPGGGGRGELNVPIVKDQLAFRISGYDEHTPGYIYDTTTGQNDDNAVQRAGGRFALLWKPTTDISVQLGAIYQYSHADNLAETAVNSTTNQPLAGNLSDDNLLAQPFTQELQLYDATIAWDLHFATLTSTTSYQTFSNDTTQDITSIVGVLLGVDSDFHEDYRLKKVTQEIRLASPEGQAFEWMVGGYYTHETGTNYEVFNAYSSPGVAAPGYNPLEAVSLPSTYDEYAVFGNATYHFTSWFDLGAGVRYAHNDQHFAEYTSGVLVGGVLPTDLGASSEGVTTFAVYPTLHLSQSTLAYARIATGYQPGGPNVILPGVGVCSSSITTNCLPQTFTSSRLIDYQVGLKSTLLDGHATVDVSAFYIDWTKIQVGVQIGDASGIDNAASARSEGFDFAGTWSPIRGLTFGATLDYTDAFLTSPIASIGSVYGARIPYVPMWSGALTLDYQKQLDDRWRGFVGGGWRYTGSRYSDVQGSTADGHPQGLEAPAYGVIDLHVGVRDHDLTLSLFAKNLADRRTLLAPIGELSFGPAQDGYPVSTKAAVLQPRTIGFSVDKSF